MKTIAVSGTNGKSTTTAIDCQRFLIDAGKDPNRHSWEPNLSDLSFRRKRACWQEGIGLIVEACEHMANMLKIQPEIAVITNIEEDHLDFYRDLDHIRETFQEWIDCKDGCGQVVLNSADPESLKLDHKYKTYFTVENRRIEDGKHRFDVAGVPVELSIPGAFNALNAAAALTAAHTAGIDDDVAVQSLAAFLGTWRRFEHVGQWEGADVYSDYAHHPTAIQGSIQAFKEFFPDRRLCVGISASSVFSNA